MRQAHEFKLASDAADLAVKQAGLTKEQRDLAEKDKNNVLFGKINNMLYNGSTPVVNMVQNLANSILKEPNPTVQAEKWQAVGARLHAKLGNKN
jgi:hypothetical protein